MGESIVVEELDIGPRSYNVLKGHNLNTIEDIERLAPSDWQSLELGTEGRREILRAIKLRNRIKSTNKRSIQDSADALALMYWEGDGCKGTPDGYIRTEQVLKYLRVNRMTFWRQRKSGIGPPVAFKHGRIALYRTADIKRWCSISGKGFHLQKRTA